MEWFEQFENIATLVGWDAHWRLVHLTSNLRGTAAVFYRSCRVEARSQYDSLVEALKRRFMPVRLTAVQTQLFHNRQQAEGETVEQFAQELQKFFNQATLELRRRGQRQKNTTCRRTLLANEFVTGLRTELKRKLIGVEGSRVEGSLEELVLKARFEEAKGLREHSVAQHRRAAPQGRNHLQRLCRLCQPTLSVRHSYHCQPISNCPGEMF